MNEKSTKRREWVKTAAIVFLSVMLVLTFFSQTIMNYSLPIVAAQYVNSGSITAKVRGTGNVEAADPYNVEIKETRVISSVAVKKGETVEKDQVLFYLEDAESEELKAAQKALDEMLLSFKQSLLSGDISNSVINNAQSGVETSTAAYQARITAAQNTYDAWEAQVKALEKQKALLGDGNGTTTSESDAVAKAKAKLDTAQANLASAQAALGGITTTGTEADAKSNMESLLTVRDSFAMPKDNAETEMNAKAKKKEALAGLHTARITYDEIISKDSVTQEEKDAAESNWNAAVTASGLGDAYTSKSADDIKGELTTAQGEYETAAKSFTDAKAVYDEADAAYQSAKTAYDKFAQKAAAQTAVNNAQNAVNTAQTEYNNAVNALNNKENSSQNTKTELDKKITEAVSARDAAKENLDQVITDISKELELGAQNSAIMEQRELVEELRAKSIGAEVKAPVAGTVTALNYVAGETVNAQNPLAVIQPDGKGFSLSFSVTADQAKKLTPGDPAEVQNSWYYNDITATLAQIKADPENPGKNKLLTFDITGDVVGGQSLSLSVGQKSANYDMIVPNSAIREDNNGKFILIVESKSSPLGNRYIASRVDVEVLASDDTQSAISGALYGYEFVITTSNKPVEAGKQVRLSDN